jgi:outer membrane protein OmpA-like peptidoglycan-associated protein
MMKHLFRIVLRGNLFRIPIGASALIAMFSILSLALAIGSQANANVIGADAQNFNPTTNGIDFVTVQSSETLKPGVINLGLFLNHAVNSLPYFDQTSGSRLVFADSLTSFDFNAGMGLTKNWDVGFSLPQVLRQQVDDGSGTRGEFASTGITEARLNTKYRFFGDAEGGLATILSTNFNMIGNNPYSGNDSGPTINIELAADTTVHRFALGGNLGYRMRSKGTKIPGSIADPLGNQFIASAAASYHFPEYSTKIITEVFGALPAEKTNSFGDRSLSSFEWLIGVKHDVTTNLALHAGGGTELLQGVASPDWRLYAGLNYTFGPVFDDKQPSPNPARPSDTRYLEAVPTISNAVIQERFRTQSILFAFDSDRMIGAYDEVLQELADTLAGGFKKLKIEGHTDSVGPVAYNEGLSLRRAVAIRKRLIEKFKQPASKIQAIGYGESRPIADNANYQGRQANRRVEFEIDR